MVRYTHTCLIIAVQFCFSYNLILCKTFVNNENQTHGSAVLPKHCNLLKDTGYSSVLLKQEVHLKQHWCLWDRLMVHSYCACLPWCMQVQNIPQIMRCELIRLAEAVQSHMAYTDSQCCTLVQHIMCSSGLTFGIPIMETHAMHQTFEWRNRARTLKLSSNRLFLGYLYLIKNNLSMIKSWRFALWCACFSMDTHIIYVSLATRD